MTRMLYKWIMIDLLGWKIEGHFPRREDIPKYVVASAPHTSSWDLFLGLATRSIDRASYIGFVGKKELFRFPIGPIMRWLGGYPVDRSRRSNYVDAVVDVFDQHKTFAICIAPEGTRKRVAKLRSGFYWIARKAGIPIVLTALDYGNRVLRISDPIYPTENAEADIEQIVSFFRGVKGKNPERGIHF